MHRLHSQGVTDFYLTDRDKKNHYFAAEFEKQGFRVEPLHEENEMAVAKVLAVQQAGSAAPKGVLIFGPKGNAIRIWPLAGSPTDITDVSEYRLFVAKLSSIFGISVEEAAKIVNTERDLVILSKEKLPQMETETNVEENRPLNSAKSGKVPDKAPIESETNVEVEGHQHNAILAPLASETHAVSKITTIIPTIRILPTPH
ncbi:hypothetical protein DCS_04391 [Drechmeria coniospora]|uniref:Uncharacterized protein n=1 Tax=Drechmeria coniospora TaxID=98403 RepID=A0A151GK46_DRECN|nr:hypothetical protein DCS_04391 [Drechmeria coniospora]KYK57382.1 hypothetical protein DCS_04391 [Drechmeria coniospora]